MGFDVTLNEDGVAVETIAEAFTNADDVTIKAYIGCSDIIYVWETLALLVALRTWPRRGRGHPHFRTKFACATPSLAKLTTKSSNSLEVALEVCLGSVEDTC